MHLKTTRGEAVLQDLFYTYDPIYRLIAAAGQEHIGQAGQPETSWDDEFRVNLPHPSDGQAMRNYTEQYFYDAVGNFERLIHQAVNDVPPPNTVPETTFYVYDAGGERVRKVTERQNGTRKQERIYLGGFEIYREFDSTGNNVKLERETLHGMDDKQRIALVETKTIANPDDESPTQLIRFQLSNHLGSACLELDDKANVISYEEYYPYGSTAYQAVDKRIKAAAKRYRYTGKERDEETGLYYHGARYYAPWLGRWTSCDPIGLFMPSSSHNCPPLFKGG